MSQEPGKHRGSHTGTEEQTEFEVQIPRKYIVVLHNDDYTPMDFVIDVLMQIFGKDEMAAMQIMLNIHHLGTGVCGVFPFEIAEMKITRVHDLAAKSEYPLRASMEEE